MKRGRDDEKNVEPMFPRLHVNDTEKGGPRAPPRNKMALYEQLSIPSQRFNSGLSPVNPNNINNLNPPSSSQGSGHDNSILRRQPPRSVHRADEPTRCDAYLNPSLVQTEPKRGQEEYFTISKFVQSNIGEDPPDNNNSTDKQRLSPFCLFYSDHVVNSQKTGEEGLKQFSTSRINLRQGVNIGSEGNSKELVELRVQSKYSDTNQSSRELSESPSKQFHVSLSFKQREHTPNILHSYINSQDNLQHDYRGDSQLIKTAWGAGLSADRSSSLGNRNSSTYLGNLQQDKQRSPRIPTNDAGSHEDTCRSLETEIMDRGDDVSDTSVVDSMSGTDISPDDVVGMIGQKHFWKARRAIVNQQRVFAVQVFELHRLIKVQKLIAESPHILLEDAYLGKTVNGSPEKKNASDCIVKTTREIVKHNDVSEKPVNRIESSAENAVEKTSIPVLEKGNQPPNYGLFSGNPPPLPAITDTYMGSWGFNQPSGHQWLVPVMTPSEGLVYKPYPAPGFMNPAYGPPGSTPIMRNYINYGAPAPQHPYQGVGSGSFVLPPGNGYFPPFGMPMMHPPAMEHMNNLYTQNQASCNGPSQKTADIPKAVKLNPSKDPGVQGSTASSPSERKQKSKVVQTTTTTNERRSGALSLFPTSPVDQVPNADGPDQPTQVIKVVPHNARSATESVARIFRSIQEQRKQFNS